MYELSFKIKRRSMSDPTLSDIGLKNIMACVWTTLNATSAQ